MAQLVLSLKLETTISHQNHIPILERSSLPHLNIGTLLGTLIGDIPLALLPNNLGLQLRGDGLVVGVTQVQAVLFLFLSLLFEKV